VVPACSLVELSPLLGESAVLVVADCHPALVVDFLGYRKAARVPVSGFVVFSRLVGGLAEVVVTAGDRHLVTESLSSVQDLGHG
jgi:hypothetical protein